MSTSEHAHASCKNNNGTADCSSDKRNTNTPPAKAHTLRRQKAMSAAVTVNRKCDINAAALFVCSVQLWGHQFDSVSWIFLNENSFTSSVRVYPLFGTYCRCAHIDKSSVTKRTMCVKNKREKRINSFGSKSNFPMQSHYILYLLVSLYFIRSAFIVRSGGSLRIRVEFYSAYKMNTERSNNKTSRWLNIGSVDFHFHVADGCRVRDDYTSIRWNIACIVNAVIQITYNFYTLNKVLH